MIYFVLFILLLLGMFIGVFVTLTLLKPSYQPTAFQKAEDRKALSEKIEEYEKKESEEDVVVDTEIPTHESGFRSKLQKKEAQTEVASVRELNCLMAGIDPDEHVRSMQKREDSSYRALKDGALQGEEKGKKKKRRKRKKNHYTNDVD